MSDAVRKRAPVASGGTPSAAEARVLAAAGVTSSDLLVRTASTVDVGHWLGPARLWLACVDGALLLVAAGKRPHVERVAFEQLRQSLFNPMTGELVLLPAPDVRVRSVRVSPVEGWLVMKRIGCQEDKNHA
jgi:hypothetical protein